MIKYPDYENCIAGIPNSILKNMGIEPGRRTSELLDRYLAEKGQQRLVYSVGLPCLRRYRQ